MYNSGRRCMMIRKNIYIDNEQDKQIKTMAKLLGVTESEVIRKSIALYMNIALVPKIAILPKNENDVWAAQTMQELVNWKIKQLR